MDTVVCPKGHQSSDHDYCSECGAKIVNNGGTSSGNGAGAAIAATPEAEVCPDCGTARDHKGVVFCEICGYNFTTGARGEFPVNFSAVPIVEAPTVEPAFVPESQMVEWSAVVSVDVGLKQADSPKPPTEITPFSVALSKPVTLIGRTSQTRAIFPEIAIDFDDAVSHRHALLQFDADGGLVVRDIGAANGTIVNGTEIPAMVDHPLNDGDAITLGRWTRIAVKMTAARAAV